MTWNFDFPFNFFKESQVNLTNSINYVLNTHKAFCCCQNVTKVSLLICEISIEAIFLILFCFGHQNVVHINQNLCIESHKNNFFTNCDYNHSLNPFFNALISFPFI